MYRGWPELERNQSGSEGSDQFTVAGQLTQGRSKESFRSRVPALGLARDRLSRFSFGAIRPARVTQWHISRPALCHSKRSVEYQQLLKTMPCSLLEINLCFRGAFCRHNQGYASVVQA